MDATQPGQADAFGVRTEGAGDVAVVTASGEIDISSADAFAAEIERALAGDVESVVLDLEQVSFMDSTGLTALLKSIEGSDGRLRVVRSLSRAVERTLEVSGLLESLPWT